MQPLSSLQTVLNCEVFLTTIIITIGFELHAKMAEEVDLEKCNFRNFRSSVTLTLTLDRVESKSYWCAYPVEVYPHAILDRNRRNILWTDGHK